MSTRNVTEYAELRLVGLILHDLNQHQGVKAVIRENDSGPVPELAVNVDYEVQVGRQFEIIVRARRHE